MAIDVAHYNRQFLAAGQDGQPVVNDVRDEFEIGIRTLSQADLPAGATHYWRVVGIHHLNGAENGSNHNVFCDVLDEEGHRINGVELELNQTTQDPLHAVLDKPAIEPGTNFVLYKTSNADISVRWPRDNPLPSEAGTGFKIDRAGHEPGNSWGHHSFYIVFQRTPVSNLGTSSGGGEVSSSDEVSTDGDPQPPAADSLEAAITQTGQPLIIPLNKEAGFYKQAQARGLGERLSAEYDTEYQGETYRAQVYETGILYAKVGDWGNIKVIDRTN